jgi:RNA polymerase subunit RPABC4/transcription elongation factor Spt4
MIKLDEIEKAINQFLIAHGVIEDGKLVELLETIIKDFRNEKLRPLKESFVRINSKLRPLSMEVKSVVKSKCSACDAVTNVRSSVCEACASTTAKHEWVYYHGIVNTEEDHVSKAEGSELTAEEVKFFSELTLKLLESNYMSTDDVSRMKNEKWSHSTTDTALEKLRSKGWLQRDERSFWEIGEFITNFLMNR